jgi:DUF4097 and DUF4098 domain-containing protein YvlB
VSSIRRSTGLLIPGIAAIVLGIVLLVAHPTVGLAQFALRFWPLFLILAGLVRLAGFALERKPRSGFGGGVLLAAGCILLLGSLRSELTLIEIYARYWLILVAVVAAIHLVRFYSHRPRYGPPPSMFSPVGMVLTALIVGSGIAAHWIAINKPGVVSGSGLTNLFHDFRAELAPRTFSFTDPPYVVSALAPAPAIAIDNKYGAIRLIGGGSGLQVTLTKVVNASTDVDAKQIADHIRVVVNRTNSDGTDRFLITPSCDEAGTAFTADLAIQVPDAASVSVTTGNGNVSASGTQGPLTINAQGGAQVGLVDVNGVRGNVTMSLTSEDVHTSAIDGDLRMTGARQVKVAGVTGALAIAGAVTGDIDVRDIKGQAAVDAPFCRIKAQNLAGSAQLKSRHAAVDVFRAADVTVDAPECDVRIDSITGNLDVSSSNNSIKVHSVLGSMNVNASRCSVTADSVQGPVTVTTSFAAVSIKNFGQSVRVRSNNGPVSLSAGKELAGAVDVETNHGEIWLALPASSQFEFDGESEGGRVRSKGFSVVQYNAAPGIPGAQGAPGSGSSARPDHHLTFALGSGGPKVVLKTSHGDIVLEGRGREHVTSAQALPKLDSLLGTPCFPVAGIGQSANFRSGYGMSWIQS